MILIIGAGLTGLSIARHLKDTDYRIVECEVSPGGLCRSHTVDGFTFDCTGHLLHLKHPFVVRDVKALLQDNLLRIKRNAAVYVFGRYVPYPFQANLYGLPLPVIRKCIKDFLTAPARRDVPLRHNNFKQWIYSQFGSAIARYFFIPYNEKLWCRDLGKLTSSWASWAVPVPSIHEVLRATLGVAATGLGYNASFYYPCRGGIQALVNALARTVPKVETCCSVRSVNASRQIVTFDNGQTLQYSQLIATIPLPDLLLKIDDAPPWIRRAAKRLSWVSVYNINIGINRQRVSPYHWIYFPEPDFPFYRVGCYSNLSPHMAPRNTSSLYLEIALPQGAQIDQKSLFDASLNALRRCGILQQGDQVIARHEEYIRCAYVIFDTAREHMLPRLVSYLNHHNIIPAGRYGTWTYSSMQDTLIQARRIARLLT
ncbi:MAG: FAD-dependent oxidoreductase [Desulfobacterota bacterium]|nr:FAD-dependent oxidoreductase [Thermodesulfobacteriota bacterium]